MKDNLDTCQYCNNKCGIASNLCAEVIKQNKKLNF